MKGTTGGGRGGGQEKSVGADDRNKSSDSGNFHDTLPFSPRSRVAVCLIVLLKRRSLRVPSSGFFFSLENKNFCLQEPPGVKQINSGRHRRSPFLENFPLRFFYSAAGNCKGTRVQMLGIFSFDLFQSVVM